MVIFMGSHIMGVASGKRLQNHGQSPFLMGKIHHAINGKIHELSTGPFSMSLFVCLPCRVCHVSQQHFQSPLQSPSTRIPGIIDCDQGECIRHGLDLSTARWNGWNDLDPRHRLSSYTSHGSWWDDPWGTPMAARKRENMVNIWKWRMFFFLKASWKRQFVLYSFAFKIARIFCFPATFRDDFTRSNWKYNFEMHFMKKESDWGLQEYLFHYGVLCGGHQSIHVEWYIHT